VRPPGFSSYRGYGNLQAEHIRVWILGHAGWILRSYLHHLCDHGIQACYPSGHDLIIHFFYREPCLAISMPEIFGLFSQLVANLSRWEWKGEFIIWCLPPMMDSSFYSCRRANACNFIGCASSAPDGSRPRGYSRIVYSSIGSKFLRFYTSFFNLQKIFSSYYCFCSLGARSALPMGVAPEAIIWVLVTYYRLKASSNSIS
jgi:hypothetical protein